MQLANEILCLDEFVLDAMHLERALRQSRAQQSRAKQSKATAHGKQTNSAFMRNTRPCCIRICILVVLEFADGFVNRTAFVKCQSRNTRLLVMPTSDANRPVAGTAAALLEVLGPEVPTNTPAQNRLQLLGVVFDFAGTLFGLRLINRGPA